MAPSRTSRLARLLLATALTAVCGCTSGTDCRTWMQNGFKVGPEFCPPAAPLETQWIDMHSDARLLAETPDLANWWQLLGDPTLDGLIDAAYRQNLTIREAGTRIQQAEAIRGIAVGNLFPQVQEAAGDYQRIQTSRSVAVPSPVHNFSQFDLGLQAGWELDFWGRFRRSVEAADAALDASIAGYDEVTVLLLSAVASTYVELRTTQERLRIARNVIELQQGSLEIAEARFESNQTNKLDVIQAQNNIDITQSAIPLFESQLRIANNRLCVLMGLPPHELEAGLPPAPIPAVSRFVQVGVPADLLRRRPDVRRAEQLMKAQSEQIGIAEADLYPRISLIGSIEWQADNVEDLFTTDSVFGLIGPGFSWKILNYGRLQSSIELQQQRFRELVFSYQQTVLTAQQEAEDAMVAFLKAQERADELAAAVAQVNEAEEIALTLYKTGATDFNRVFLIQAFQFSQQDELVVSRATVVLSLINIYKALGGGWEIRCPNRTHAATVSMRGGESDGGMIGAIPEIDTKLLEPAADEAGQAATGSEGPQPETPQADKPQSDSPQADSPQTDQKQDPQSAPDTPSPEELRLQELLDEPEQDDGARREQQRNEEKRLQELLDDR